MFRKMRSGNGIFTAKNKKRHTVKAHPVAGRKMRVELAHHSVIRRRVDQVGPSEFDGDGLQHPRVADVVPVDEIGPIDGFGQIGAVGSGGNQHAVCRPAVRCA